SFRRVRLVIPEFYRSAFALLVVADHELPQQIVERFVFESVLCGGDAERNVIGTRKCPRVTHPTRQERDRCRCDTFCRKWCAITKSHFHIGRRQWSSQHFGHTTIGPVGSDQKRALPFRAAIANHAPSILGSFCLSR